MGAQGAIRDKDSFKNDRGWSRPKAIPRDTTGYAGYQKYIHL